VLTPESPAPGAPAGEGSHAVSRASEDPGYSVYADFIEKVLAGQEARTTSIQQRGIAVITTSGTLVTLLFAFIGLATRQGSTYTLPGDTRPWLVAAVTLFVLAAGCGLICNIPKRFTNARAQDLRVGVDQFWNESAWAASGRVARTRLDMIERAAEVNGQQAWVLFAAVILEVGALLPLAVAVVKIAS
jgi:hypothetical protein